MKNGMLLLVCLDVSNTMQAQFSKVTNGSGSQKKGRGQEGNSEKGSCICKDMNIVIKGP